MHSSLWKLFDSSRACHATVCEDQYVYDNYVRKNRQELDNGRQAIYARLRNADSDVVHLQCRLGLRRSQACARYYAETTERKVYICNLALASRKWAYWRRGVSGLWRPRRGVLSLF